MKIIRTSDHPESRNHEAVLVAVHEGHGIYKIGGKGFLACLDDGRCLEGLFASVDAARAEQSRARVSI